MWDAGAALKSTLRPLSFPVTLMMLEMSSNCPTLWQSSEKTSSEVAEVDVLNSGEAESDENVHRLGFCCVSLS